MKQLNLFLKLTKPIVFFDIETTGIVVELDRIIEIALFKIYPDGKTKKLTQRFDPGIHIPFESSEIHGIYNADLEGQPRFDKFAINIYDFISDSDLGGYGLRRLDIPLLTLEFKKAGLTFSLEGRKIIDVSAIYREKERRNLSAAYQFYCGKNLEGAHSAEVDNDATYDVFVAQLEKYSDLPKDILALHKFCSSPDKPYVDRGAKLLWRDGEAYFAFGKHQYKSLREVANTDEDYLHWIIYEGNFNSDFVEICSQALQGSFPKRETPSKNKKNSRSTA